MQKVKKALERYTVESLPASARSAFMNRHAGYRKRHELSQKNKTGDWFNIFFYQWYNFDFMKGNFRDPDMPRALRILDFFIMHNRRYEVTDPWSGKEVLNVGSHCGLEALVITAFGAKSVACLDEHEQLAEVNEFLTNSFQINNCHVIKDDLYNIPRTVIHKYDIVYFSGVLYHLSDPYRALRILYNSLKKGGILFLETLALPEGSGDERTMEYHGPSVPGWNWFIPSAKCCAQITKDAGFDEVVPLGYWADKRFCLVAKKHAQRPAAMYAGVANSDEL